MIPLRHVFVCEIALRKMGAYERWLLAFGERVRQEQHQLEIWCEDPVLPELSREFDTRGIVVRSLYEYRGTPQVSDSHRNIIWTHFLGSTSPPFRRAAASIGVPLIFVDHTSGMENHSTLGRSLWRTIVGRGLRYRLSAYVAVSEFVAERARRVLRLPPRLLNVVHNGIASRPFVARRATTEPQMICVANLISEKAVDVLLQAGARVRELAWRLLIVGEGPERARLEALAMELGIADRVSFLGRRGDVPELLEQSDIAVHPATWAEACAYTVLEALAAGTALVATSTGGTPELVRHDQTGLLVPPGDPVALAAALERLIGDADFRDRLGRAGHADAAGRFSLPVMADRYVSIAQAVADRRWR